jgi:hypothetical protein
MFAKINYWTIKQLFVLLSYRLWLMVLGSVWAYRWRCRTMAGHDAESLAGLTVFIILSQLIISFAKHTVGCLLSPLTHLGFGYWMEVYYTSIQKCRFFFRFSQIIWESGKSCLTYGLFVPVNVIVRVYPLRRNEVHGIDIRLMTANTKPDN